MIQEAERQIYINEFMDRVAEAWLDSPDLRFMQLVECLVGCHREGCNFYMTDHHFLCKLDEWENQRDAKS